MKINDPIYGTVDIDQRLHTLMGIPAVVRLKKIHQNGADFLVDPRRRATRYEHSVGVMILLHKLGASIEEQAAGLLHDISHTVFSHNIDLLFNTEKHDYHEQKRNEYIKSTNVRKELEQLGFNSDHVINIENFTILDKEMPDLCADRLDYTFRDLFNTDYLSSEEVDLIISNIVVQNDVIKVKNVKIGRLLIEKFIKLNSEIFFNPKFEAANLLLSKTIGMLIKRGELSNSDLFNVDDYIIKIIEKSGYASIFQLINSNLKVQKVSHKGDFSIKRYFRIIDPLLAGQDHRISILDDYSKKMLTQYLKEDKIVNYRIVM